MDKSYSVTVEVTFCIGSREGYNGPFFTRNDLLTQINNYQYIHPKAMPVKVSDTVTFTMKDYREDGWEISAITYPHSPNHPGEVQDFMLGLAENLLEHFKQNRITVRYVSETPDYSGHRPPTTIMLENKNAEKTHKK